MANEEPTKPDPQFSEEELEQQQGEPLPDREAMSIIQPEPIPYPLPFPVDDTATDTSPGTPKDSPFHTMPIEPNPKA